MVALAALAGCGGGSEGQAKQLVEDFWAADNGNDGFGDCAAIEAITTERFQTALGCDWLTAVSSAEVVGEMEVETIDSDHVTVRHEFESFAYDGTMVFDIVKVNGEWLIDMVDAL